MTHYRQCEFKQGELTLVAWVPEPVEEGWTCTLSDLDGRWTIVRVGSVRIDEASAADAKNAARTFKSAGSIAHA